MKVCSNKDLCGQRAQVWATYTPVNLHAAWRFAQGYSVEDAEFSLTGITEVTGVDDETPALLHNLPQSLRTLTFATGWKVFNQSLDNVTWPAGLQSLTFGRRFQSEPGQRDMASRPSKFDFWRLLSIRAWTT